MLNREPMWLKLRTANAPESRQTVSVLNREPMWLKWANPVSALVGIFEVSVLNREPMWLKYDADELLAPEPVRFQCSTVSRCG